MILNTVLLGPVPTSCRTFTYPWYIWNNDEHGLIDADSEKLDRPLQNGKKLVGLF